MTGAVHTKLSIWSGALSSREAALNIHKAVGFQVAEEEEGLLRLELGREAFRQLKNRGIEKVPVDSPQAVGRQSLPGSCVEIKL